MRGKGKETATVTLRSGRGDDGREGWEVVPGDNANRKRTGAASALSNGDTVVLHSLQARPELNGKYATVVTPFQPKHRAW